MKTRRFKRSCIFVGIFISCFAVYSANDISKRDKFGTSVELGTTTNTEIKMLLVDDDGAVVTISAVGPTAKSNALHDVHGTPTMIGVTTNGEIRTVLVGDDGALVTTTFGVTTTNLLNDGTVPMAADLNMGGFSITNGNALSVTGVINGLIDVIDGTNPELEIFEAGTRGTLYVNTNDSAIVFVTTNSAARGFSASFTSDDIGGTNKVEVQPLPTDRFVFNNVLQALGKSIFVQSKSNFFFTIVGLTDTKWLVVGDATILEMTP